jgi:hypothetical protein
MPVEKTADPPATLRMTKLREALPFVINSEWVSHVRCREHGSPTPWRLVLKDDGMGGDDSLAFLHRDGLIGFEIRDRVFLTAGPDYSQPHSSI